MVLKYGRQKKVRFRSTTIYLILFCGRWLNRPIRLQHSTRKRKRLCCPANLRPLFARVVVEVRTGVPARRGILASLVLNPLLQSVLQLHGGNHVATGYKQKKQVHVNWTQYNGVYDFACYRWGNYKSNSSFAIWGSRSLNKTKKSDIFIYIMSD